MNNFDDFNAYTKNSKAIPFYMAYPMGIWREGSDDARRDAEYLISLYPTDARKIQRHLEDALEIMEYPGSMIYDEYPDRIMLRRISLDIQRRCNDVEEIESKSDLIDVLLCQELLRRRHKEERKFYNY